MGNQFFVGANSTATGVGSATSGTFRTVFPFQSADEAEAYARALRPIPFDAIMDDEARQYRALTVLGRLERLFRR